MYIDVVNRPENNDLNELCINVFFYCKSTVHVSVRDVIFINNLNFLILKIDFISSDKLN